MVAHDLLPSLHISEITAKAHQPANSILRCFVSNDDVNLLARAFTVYVRPLVESLFHCMVTLLKTRY